MLSEIRGAQGMAESGPKHCSHHHSFQRKPHLRASWEFQDGPQGHPGMRNTWCPGALGTPCPKLGPKESGSHNLSRKPQCSWTAPSQSQCSGVLSQRSGQVHGNRLWTKCQAVEGPSEARRGNKLRLHLCMPPVCSLQKLEGPRAEVSWASGADLWCQPTRACGTIPLHILGSSCF